MTTEMRSLISGFLKIEVSDRLGCGPKRTEDVKTHKFFRSLDWGQVYLLQLTPPLVPSRGTVNAAATIEIGTFGNEDGKQKVRSM